MKPSPFPDFFAQQTWRWPVFVLLSCALSVLLLGSLIFSAGDNVAFELPAPSLRASVALPPPEAKPKAVEQPVPPSKSTQKNQPSQTPEKNKPAPENFKSNSPNTLNQALIKQPSSSIEKPSSPSESHTDLPKTSATSPSTEPPKVTPSSTDGGSLDPQKKSPLECSPRTEPTFPRNALVSGISTGFVEARLTIGAQGRVKNVRVERAEPAGYFERAVRQAVESWQCTARGTDYEVLQRFEFSLKDKN